MMADFAVDEEDWVNSASVKNGRTSSTSMREGCTSFGSEHEGSWIKEELNMKDEPSSTSIREGCTSFGSDQEGSWIKDELYMKDELLKDDDAEKDDQTIDLSSLLSNIPSIEENERSAPQTDGDIKELFVIKHETTASDKDTIVDLQYDLNLHEHQPKFMDIFGIVHNLECRVVLKRLSENKIFKMTNAGNVRRKRVFDCDKCEYRGRKLKRHYMSAHKSERPFACKNCDYRGSLLSELKRHMRTHTDKRPYVCKNCDYRGSKLYDLKRHMRTHTRERSFACNKCDYRAATNSNLKRHIMTTHAGEKPYLCNECDFKAGRSDILKTHILTHTGERPYACDICDYTTGRLDCMKLHWNAHTLDYKYPCNICNYKASQPAYMRAHMATHTGGGPYFICDICDFRTVNVGKLKGHKTRMHKPGRLQIQINKKL